MMPSVPSEPTNSCVRSGPTAARGAPPVVTSGAVGEHDVEALDDVLDLAVAGRELAGAAAREPAADGRQRHRLRPVPARDAVRRRAARPRTRRRTCRAARRRASTCGRRRRSRRARSGRAARRRTPGRSRRTRRCGPRPRSPGRAPRCTAAARPRPRRAECGRTTTDARAATWSSSAQIIASGHQSRLASPISGGVGRDVGAGRGELRRAAGRRPRRAVVRAGRARRPRHRRTRSEASARPGSSPCRRETTIPALRRWLRQRVERGLGQAAGRALGVDQRPVAARPGGRVRRRSNRARRP